MRKTVMIMCALAIVAIATPAWAVDLYFHNGTGDGKWSTIGNWEDQFGNVLPVTPGGDNRDTVYMGGGHTCILDTYASTDYTNPNDGWMKRLHGSYDTQLGTLQLEDGADILVWTYSVFGGINGPAKIVQNGGTMTMYANQDWPWNGPAASTYELHGGEFLRPNTLTYWLMDGDGGNTISCLYSQDGGVYNSAGNMEIAVGAITGSSATAEISGGTMYIENLRLMRKAAGAGTTGSGTAIFKVTGTWEVPNPDYDPEVPESEEFIPGTIGLGTYLQANPGVGLNATLECEADSGGSTTIAVTGTATFESGTEVILTREVGVTPPQKGDYDILTADNIADGGMTLTYDSTFWNVVVTPGTQGNAGDNGSITATFLVHPGDASLDDSVDGADYTLYAAKYGLAGGWGDGDFNNDGVVDGADYTIYAANYGKSGGAIPEPITLTLLGLGGLAMLRRRRR